jgi:DNA-binding beta-propeller fold protein YncE
MRRVLAASASALMLGVWQAPAASGADSLYWSAGNSAIRTGPLDGSAPASDLFPTESGPFGVAIDPATGKIYWADYSAGAIRVANLNGSGSPQNLYTGESFPQGVAIDPTAGKLYWAETGAGAIRVANLDGTGSPTTLFSSEGSPRGVAIDPADGKIFWADFGGSGPIRSGDINGTGSASSLYTTGEAYPEGIAVDPQPESCIGRTRATAKSGWGRLTA